MTADALLPVTHSQASLKDVARIVMGQSPPSSTYNSNGCGIPFLQGKAEFGATSPSPTKWCSQPAKIAPSGSVLISVRAPVGSVNLADQQYCIGRGLAAAAPGPDLDAHYLYYYLLTQQLWFESQSSGTTFQSVNAAVLRNLPVPLLSLDNQRWIVRILSTIVQAREDAETVVAASCRLRESLRATFFDHSEWPLQNLGDVATIRSGGTPSRAEATYWGGDIPWVKTGEIDYAIILRSSEFITKLGLDNSSARIYSSGTILMAMYGDGVTRGKVAILGLDAAINQACAAIMPNQSLDKQFLYQYLANAYEDIRSIGHGAHQKNLSAALLKRVPVPVPALSEQTTVAEALSTIDAKIAAEYQIVEALVDLFNSTLRSLFSTTERMA